MSTIQNNDHDNHDEKKGQGINFTRDNEGLKHDRQDITPDGQLPEDDPALINPDELATFPEEKKTEDPDLDAERENHMVSRKSSAVRDGRNITRTDTNPDNGGFM